MWTITPHVPVSQCSLLQASDTYSSAAEATLLEDVVLGQVSTAVICEQSDIRPALSSSGILAKMLLKCFMAHLPLLGLHYTFCSTGRTRGCSCAMYTNTHLQSTKAQ